MPQTICTIDVIQKAHTSLEILVSKVGIERFAKHAAVQFKEQVFPACYSCGIYCLLAT